MKPDMKVKMGPKCFPDIRMLEEGKSVDVAQIRLLCEYIDQRLDCADFRMTAIIRTLYAYRKLLGADIRRSMEQTVFQFKYWMDEPGDDNMCYWSENHQILFAAVEYLAGQLYPDTMFTNAAMTGREHMEKAKVRILRWLQHRFDYGFTEWHSNTYYEEDIAPLSLLIDFAVDQEVVKKSQMVMDLILLDMAIHSWRGLFCAASGRCYEAQKKNPKMQDTLEISEAVWHFGHIKAHDFSRITANFLLMKNYDLPEVITAIGRDSSDVEIRDSMGLNLSEISDQFLDLMDIDTTGMFLWGMESFTNPESVDMALKIFNEWKLHQNSFLKDFKMINHQLLRKSGLLPLVVKALNPVTQGIAIQRANTYTYKTRDYMLSTAQRHHPGEFADQQHIWQATLSESITVFTTHPGAPAFSDTDRNFSPDYWVGNGILPHSVQHKNVHISIYDLRGRKGFMEKKRMLFTHAYFPQERFDQVVIEKNYVFGRKGGVYIALIGRYPLRPNPADMSDILQEGLVTYWICVLGTAPVHHSFEEFMACIKSREVVFSKNTLNYKAESTYSLTYKGAFAIGGRAVSTEYDRLQTPYGRVERNPKEIRIAFEGKSLYLHFDKLIRTHE